MFEYLRTSFKSQRQFCFCLYTQLFKNYIIKKKKEMGIFDDFGDILPYQEAQKLSFILKEKVIRQFLNIIQKYKNYNQYVEKEQIKWGDEIQGHLLDYDNEKQLQLSKTNILNTQNYPSLEFQVMAQMGNWMFELVPTEPYCTKQNLQEVIISNRFKYKALQQKYPMALTIPMLPFFTGIKKNSFPQNNFINQVTKSRYIPDELITPCPRYLSFAKNIRMRRGETVDIRVPLFIDQNTNFNQLRKNNEPYDGFIHMDSTLIGMSCHQFTVSTVNFDKARYVYDQFNILSPLFLALSAGTPFYKEKLSNWDVRWNIFSQTTDDRTKKQRDPQDPEYISDSRHSLTNYYIWNGLQNNIGYYNDFKIANIESEIERIKKVSKELQIEIDTQLIHHLSYIIKRDFLTVFTSFQHIQDSAQTLFKIINAQNWNSVRLKAPLNNQNGWMVEFRTTEAQLMADQNAAYSILLHLIARVLHQQYDINLYIPITKLRQNFNRAHTNDAIRVQKFFFKTNIFEKGDPVIQELSLFQILFGKKEFQGLFNIVARLLPEQIKGHGKVKQIISSIKQYFFKKTSGQTLSLAQWMRQYIRKDPRYKKNSILPKQVMDDLLKDLNKISKGQMKDSNFETIFDLQKILNYDNNQRNRELKKQSMRIFSRGDSNSELIEN